MSQAIGNAAIGWTPSTGTETERVHRLRVPLTDLRPEHTLFTAVADSLDKTARETLSVGSGAHELRGSVIFDEDPQSLLDLIAEGSKGTSLVYYPDLADPDVSYTCHLIAPLSPVGVGVDAQRGTGFGEASVELVLRVTDETPFQPLYQGSKVLFWYRAGNDLSQATYTRSGTATYAAKGFGTLTDASTDKARLHWMSTASSVGPRDTPTLLLEPASTNVVTESSDFGTWSVNGSPVRTSGQSDPRGGSAAWLLDDDSTSSVEFIYHQISSTLLSSTVAAMSVFLKAGTTASSAGVQVILLSSIAPASTAIKFTVAWSSGVPSVTWNVGSSRMVERWRNGWYRIGAVSTAAISSSKAHRMRIVPAPNVAARLGNVYGFGAQVEQ